MLENAGFVDVETEAYEAMFYFRDEHDWWAWEWSQASRFWVEAMSPEGLARFKSESFEHLRRMQTPRGIPTLQGMLFMMGRRAAA